MKTVTVLATLLVPPLIALSSKAIESGTTPTETAPTPTYPFEITFHVAAEDTDATWRRIEAKVRRANEVYDAAGIAFSYHQHSNTLPEAFAVLDNIPERHHLKRHLDKRAVNVVVVDQILDPHPSAATKKAAKWQGFAPSGRLAGAHIPRKKGIPPTYIIITAGSHDLTLAHELGHLLGLPHHKDPENIMSYGNKRHRFTDGQREVLRRHAKKLCRQLKCHIR